MCAINKNWKSAKSKAQEDHKRMKDLGIKSFTWRTCNDNQVCDECRRRDGKRYKWSDLPPDELPGQRPGCRCYAEGDVQQAFDELF